MKFLVIPTTAILVSLVALNMLSTSPKPSKIPLKIHEMYKKWKLENKKFILESPSEELYRLKIFYNNYLYIKSKNSRQKSYKLSLNKFADMTNEEIKAKYTGYSPKNLEKNSKKKFSFLENSLKKPTLESLDWREKGALTPIKNQKTCGSCWAFSAACTIESAHFIKHNEKVVLSEQQLNDCSWTEDNHGCKGGLASLAFKYVIKEGITSDAQYPYKSKDDDCFYLPKMKVTGLTDFTQIVGDEEEVLQAIQKMPVSSGVNSTPILRYQSGIYDDIEECPPSDVDHAVVIVGYGTENGKDFWIVRNSWGESWGENGYFRLARGDNGPGMCGITRYPFIVDIE